MGLLMRPLTRQILLAENTELRAERARLREALEQVANGDVWNAQAIARAALNPGEKP